MSVNVIPNLFHSNDPNLPKDYHCWHFVYLHGAAENHNEKKAFDNNWAWRCPDLVISDQPIPKIPGHYEANLYGMKVIAVMARRIENHLAGRVADPTDVEGFAHASKPEEWC
jgi:hypothetical protein